MEKKLRDGAQTILTFMLWFQEVAWSQTVWNASTSMQLWLDVFGKISFNEKQDKLDKW